MSDKAPDPRRIAVGAAIGFLIVLAITLVAAITVGDGQAGLIVAAVLVSLFVGGGIGGLIAARMSASDS
jgi:hypothetical protein